jgi:hypothetical protein
VRLAIRTCSRLKTQTARTTFGPTLKVAHNVAMAGNSFCMNLLTTLLEDVSSEQAGNTGMNLFWGNSAVGELYLHPKAYQTPL